MSESQLAKIEKAERWPDLHVARAADQLFGTGGTFANLWLLVDAERQSPSGEAYKAAPDAYFPAVYGQGAGSAPTMELRLNQEGDIVAEINRRTVLIASASSLAFLAGDPAHNALVPARPAAYDDPFGFAQTLASRWPDAEVARTTTSRGGMDWQVLLPGGRNMLGADAACRSTLQGWLEAGPWSRSRTSGERTSSCGAMDEAGLSGHLMAAMNSGSTFSMLVRLGVVSEATRVPTKLPCPTATNWTT